MKKILSHQHRETYREFLRQSDLVGKDGLLPFSSATLWRMVKAGAFPKPIKLSDRITAWRFSDVREWMEQQNNQRDVA